MQGTSNSEEMLRYRNRQKFASRQFGEKSSDLVTLPLLWVRLGCVCGSPQIANGLCYLWWVSGSFKFKNVKVYLYSDYFVFCVFRSLKVSAYKFG